MIYEKPALPNNIEQLETALEECDQKIITGGVLDEKYKRTFLGKNQELSDEELLQISDKESEVYEDFENLVDVAYDLAKQCKGHPNATYKLGLLNGMVNKQKLSIIWISVACVLGDEISREIWEGDQICCCSPVKRLSIKVSFDKNIEVQSIVNNSVKTVGENPEGEMLLKRIENLDYGIEVGKFGRNSKADKKNNNIRPSKPLEIRRRKKAFNLRMSLHGRATIGDSVYAASFVLKFLEILNREVSTKLYGLDYISLASKRENYELEKYSEKDAKAKTHQVRSSSRDKSAFIKKEVCVRLPQYSHCS
ncbi:hypothetical protein H8356DRAFT_1356211 [Neocallimastix lanati (nom. inval.)]|nr:hypothetical protein H8356DRAFT_1356211 [Neocallimastix sp. JGI-2020a]